MKVRYSRVYKNHWSKLAVTYLLSRQGKSTTQKLPNRKLTNQRAGNNKEKEAGQFKTCYNIISLQNQLVTDISLESFRITLNRLLNKYIGKVNWSLVIRKKSHIILRKHKMPEGGSVDRVSAGMRLAYGVPFNRAAKCMNQQILFSVYHHKQDSLKLKPHIKKALSKVTGNYKILLTND